MRLLLAFLIGCGGDPDPAPAPKPAPAPAADAGAADAAPRPAAKRYHRALNRGRRLAQEGDPRGAVAAFEDALADRPDDARALSELGWALFRAGDLPRAEEVTRRAIARAAEPKVKAASLYNLGRIHEALGQTDAARDAYARSQKLRPSRTVRERLAALGRGPAPDAVIPPAPLSGPFATLADACAAENRAHPSFPVRCLPDESGLVSGPARAIADGALAEARVFAMADEYGDRTCHLGLRTAAGWWTVELFPCAQESEAGRLAVTAEELRLEDLIPGGAREALGRFVVSAPQLAEEESAAGVVTERRWRSCQRILVVCGVGRSGRPSCTPDLAIAAAADCGDPPVWDAALETRIEGGLLRVVAPSAAATADEELKNAIGAYGVTFP